MPESSVKKINLVDYHINFCRDCLSCRDRVTEEAVSPCVIRDDMDTITREPILPGDPIVETGETGQTWWDPVLGLTMHFPVTPRVGFLIRAIGGGFGIGNASDYMWDAELASAVSQKVVAFLPQRL